MAATIRPEITAYAQYDDDVLVHRLREKFKVPTVDLTSDELMFLLGVLTRRLEKRVVGIPPVH